jgi:hypothetical protein
MPFRYEKPIFQTTPGLFAIHYRVMASRSVFVIFRKTSTLYFCAHNPNLIHFTNAKFYFALELPISFLRLFQSPFPPWSSTTLERSLTPCSKKLRFRLPLSKTQSMLSPLIPLRCVMRTTLISLSLRITSRNGLLLS